MYAENTTVAVEKSISEIVALVKKSGAQRVAQAETETGLAIQFFLRDRMLRFHVELPQPGDVGATRGYRPATAAEQKKSAEQRARQRARALLLVIKAKLESVESDVETFDEAFMPNIVMSDGKTVGAYALPAIESSYRDGRTPPLMLGYDG
jgi:hypothetical protein